jgi:hypothetical protein
MVGAIPVAKTLDPPEPLVSQLLHRTVVARVTEERDLVRKERDSALREMKIVREALDRKRARSSERWQLIHATARHVEYDKLDEKLLPGAVGKVVQERDDLRTRVRDKDRELARLKWQADRYGAICSKLDRQTGDDVVTDVVDALGELHALKKRAAFDADALATLRDEAWKTVELRDGGIAGYQATEAEIAGLLGRFTVDTGNPLGGESRRPLAQRVKRELQTEFRRGRDEGVASGRAAAIVEAVDMVENNFAHGDRVSDDTAKTAQWIVEQLKRIKP